MKYIAKQVPPEYQESPLFADYFPEDIIVTGNDRMYSHNMNLLERVPVEEIDAANSAEDLAAALTRHTGETWETREIRGCCQGDWQRVYYPVNAWSRAALEGFETEYFNTGTEYAVSSPDDFDTFIYCHGWSHDQHRAEIAVILGTDPENITLLTFTGYTKTPNYEEAI